jgi:hypothetical protein
LAARSAADRPSGGAVGRPDRVGLLSAAHSFLVDLLDLPFGVWIFFLLIPVAAVVFFLWPALGMSAAVVLIGLAVLWFMFS